MGVEGRDGGAEGLRAGLLIAFFSASGGTGVGGLLPGFETTRVTNPSVRFSKLAACKCNYF